LREIDLKGETGWGDIGGEQRPEMGKGVSSREAKQSGQATAIISWRQLLRSRLLLTPS